MKSKIYNNLNKRTEGFTLVEMLVSTAIFLSVMVVAVGSLISIIDANKRSQSIKSVVDNVTFAIENISRDMRSGTNYKCLGDSADEDGNCQLGGAEVSYLPSDSPNTVHYRYRKAEDLSPGDGNIQKCIDIINGCQPDSIGWKNMTAPISVVNITNMSFYVLGLGTNGGTPTSRQPRVIITAQGLIIDKDGKQTSFSLQTTASQRTRQSFN